MRARGITLIELSIALAVIAVLFSVVVIGVGALTGASARSAAGELGGVIRSLYDTAALSGKTCRLVFDLPGPKDDDRPARYWAECASTAITASRDRDEELREAERNMKRGKDKIDEDDRRGSSGEPTLQTLLSVEKERIENSSRFAQFTSEQIEERELPGSVQIGVWTQHQRDVVKSGPAFLYFYPQGFTERAHIYVRQGDNVWTITVQPLTGKTAVVAEELEVPRS